MDPLEDDNLFTNDLDHPSDVDETITVDDLVYVSAEEWLTDWLLPTIRMRPGPNARWCPQWWAHPEAAARIGALWAAWEETTAIGGQAPSTWWLHHLDPHWQHLTSDHGPFTQCVSEHSEIADRLDSHHAPTGTALSLNFSDTPLAKAPVDAPARGRAVEQPDGT